MKTHIRRAAWTVAAAIVAAPAQGAAEAGTKNCSAVVIASTTELMLGKSSVVPLKAPVIRVVASAAPANAARQAAAQPGPLAASPAGDAADLGNIADVDILLLSPTDLFLRGKKAGATNVILQDATGVCYLHDIVVAIDPSTLQAKLGELMPDEKGIRVKSAENAIVLTGTVRDALKLDEAMRVASAYGGGKRVVNLLHVTSPQQVMLEVKIAEVSKSLMEKFGIDFSRMFTSADGVTSKVFTGIFGGAPALFGKFILDQAGGDSNSGHLASQQNGGASALLEDGKLGYTKASVEAKKTDGLIRMLAEPNIMAISGQSASFLSGGRIFIPESKTGDNGTSSTSLKEKPFGVGLTFSPTVLDGSRINLKLSAEVSELSQTGSPFTTIKGVTSVIPSISSRNIETTVQLSDGQSFAVAGLIRNNVTETINRFPGLGELPILGALFRSSAFQKDQTELIFIVTPRLVKPAAALPAPTDNHLEPGRADILLHGRTEGTPQSVIDAAAPAAQN